MSTLKAINSTYPAWSLYLSRLFAIYKGVKKQFLSQLTKLLLIFSLLLLGCNLSVAQPGNLDTSFNPGTGSDKNILATAIQSDGKIIIGGSFDSYNGTARNGIARLNKDGSLDTSFDPGTGLSGWVSTLSIQSDGKIIIGGLFTSYNGTPRNGIARLNTDGSLDTSFDPGTGPTPSNLTTSAIQSDGKIIICGSFSSYNGTPMNRIARINTDGSLDTSFDSGNDADIFYQSTAIQSDGKIIIGGLFSSYNGTPRNSIARLNADGSLDTSFDLRWGVDIFVHTISIQSDGRILIGGDYPNHSQPSNYMIARLNTDGSLDTSFDPGTGANRSIRTHSIQSDGKIIIGGSFDSYNGISINHIARLLPPTPTAVTNPLGDENIVKIFPNPFSNNTFLHTGIQLKNASLTIFNSVGQSVKQITPINLEAGDDLFLNRDHLPGGLYFIQLSQENQIIMNDKLVISD